MASYPENIYDNNIRLFTKVVVLIYLFEGHHFGSSVFNALQM